MRSPELTAITRFGLGPKVGQLARARDPRRYVEAQCDDPSAILITGLPTLDDLREQFVDKQRAYRSAKRASRRAGQDEESEALRLMANRDRRSVAQRVQTAEVEARYRMAVTTGHPFLERLVLFWSNHLAINKHGLPRRFVAGAYERDAIRPYILGRFGDMLAEAIPHPAMLMYLDNAKSAGPNSRVGKRSGKARLNENLGRELLELHTLGAGGGYTQADVNAVALTLTGWTGGFGTRRRNPDFDIRRHEPGPRTILGITYTSVEEDQLFDVLDDLSVHPSTAKHLAGKLARHFVGDDASPALIEAMRASYADTDGDLGAMTRVMVAHPDAWDGAPSKTVPPYDFVVAAGRAVDRPNLDAKFINDGAGELGQQIWQPPSPAGWPDGDGAFLGGDSLLERVDFARGFAERHGGITDVRALARVLLGDELDPFVAEALDRAEDRRQALVLLLMSPAFQRR